MMVGSVLAAPPSPQEVKTAVQVHASKLCLTEVCFFKILIRFVTFYTLFIEKSDYKFDSD